jgi:hypothetical protein
MRSQIHVLHFSLTLDSSAAPYGVRFETTNIDTLLTNLSRNEVTSE